MPPRFRSEFLFTSVVEAPKMSQFTPTEKLFTALAGKQLPAEPRIASCLMSAAPTTQPQKASCWCPCQTDEILNTFKCTNGESWSKPPKPSLLGGPWGPETIGFLFHLVERWFKKSQGLGSGPAPVLGLSSPHPGVTPAPQSGLRSLARARLTVAWWWLGIRRTFIFRGSASCFFSPHPHLLLPGKIWSSDPYSR